MATIVTRAGKGSALSHNEVDANFTNLNSDKLEANSNITVADATVTGDLTVQGTTTTLNTATLQVEDKNITLNYSTGDSSGSADGAGITIQDAVSSSTDATILWDATNDTFDFSHAIQVQGLVDIASGEIGLKNSGSVSNIKFYCEVSNAHYTALQSSPHSAYSGNVTLTLPPATDTLVGRATTDTLTNKTLTSPVLSGNVGIGTASPASLLELEGADPIITLDDTSAGGYAQVQALNGSLILMADEGASVSNSIVRFDVDGTERARIDASGRLGVNEQSPDRFLHVNSGSVNTSAKFESTDSSVFLQLTDDTNSAYVGADAGALLFQTPGSSFSTKLQISSAGDATFSGSVTTEGPDGGSIIRGWPSAPSTYSMFGTANMGSAEYAVLTDGTNTFIAGGAGGSTRIRYGNNNSDKQIEVSSAGTAITGKVTITDADYDNHLELNRSSEQWRFSPSTDGSLDIRRISGTGAARLDVLGDVALTNNQTQYYGGFGTKTTGGTTNWNDATNARSGNGHSLLTGNATNGPGFASYYHPFSFEYNTKDGTGNMTQFAIPYNDPANQGMWFRSRYNGTWSAWSPVSIGVGTTASGMAASGDIYVGVNAESYLRFQGSSGVKYARFYLESDEDVRFVEGGNAHFNGNVIAYSTTIASDAKLKDNVEPLQGCLDKVCQMRGVSYTWNEQSQKAGVEDIGVIAQEMAEIYPEVVTEVDGLNGRDPHLTVDYARLTAVLINAVKELRAEVQELKNGAAI